MTAGIIICFAGNARSLELSKFSYLANYLAHNDRNGRLGHAFLKIFISGFSSSPAVQSTVK
jgi:hypothetical protein